MRLNSATVCLLLILVFVQETVGEKLDKNELDDLKSICGKPENVFKRAMIIGGTEAKADSHPWAVAFMKHRTNLHSGSFCGGVLISWRHVLTAAHCFYRFPESDVCRLEQRDLTYPLPMVYGSVNTAQPRGYRTQEVIHLHPGFNKTACSADTVGDLAIVELQRPVAEDERVLFDGQGGAWPACLPDSDTDLARSFRTYGWGIRPDDANYYRNRNILYETTLKPCPRQPLGPTVCTAENYTNVCLGDSGGGLMQEQEHGKSAVVGVVSKGTACSDMLKYRGITWHNGIWTDVREYLPWICDKTGVC